MLIKGINEGNISVVPWFLLKGKENKAFWLVRHFSPFLDLSLFRFHVRKSVPILLPRHEANRSLQSPHVTHTSTVTLWVNDEIRSLFVVYCFLGVCYYAVLLSERERMSECN